MTGPRVLIVVLVLIAVLFVVAVASGSKNNKKTDPNQKTWVSRMGEKMIPAVDPKTLTGSCTTRETGILEIPRGAAGCEIIVPAASHAWQAFRRFGFHQKAGRVQISYDRLPKETTKLPPDPPSQDDPLFKRVPQIKRDSTSVALTILKEGGSVTVRCITPPSSALPCLVGVWTATTQKPDPPAAP